MSISALQSGLAGIQTGFSNLRRDASQIAQATAPEGSKDIEESLVNLKLDQLQIAASSKVVETVHDLIGQFLDTKA